MRDSESDNLRMKRTRTRVEHQMMALPKQMMLDGSQGRYHKTAMAARTTRLTRIVKLNLHLQNDRRRRCLQANKLVQAHRRNPTPERRIHHCKTTLYTFLRFLSDLPKATQTFPGMRLTRTRGRLGWQGRIDEVRGLANSKSKIRLSVSL